MQILESDIESGTAKDASELYGVESIKLQHWSSGGWPDRLFFIPGGRPLLIEFKRPGEKPEPRQASRIRFLKRIGYKVEVHDTKVAALRAIRKAVEASRLPKKGR